MLRDVTARLLCVLARAWQLSRVMNHPENKHTFNGVFRYMTLPGWPTLTRAKQIPAKVTAFVCLRTLFHVNNMLLINLE